MPSLPRGGGDELGREEQVSSRKVRRSSIIHLQFSLSHPLIFNIFTSVFLLPFQKQLEDYLNILLKNSMYRNYHATVRTTLCLQSLDNIEFYSR